MNISEPFIRRPVATTLLLIAITLAGAVAFRFLPVSPLPHVDFPTISVQAGLPGASPEIMASSVATPLERQFTRIASVSEMTSSSSLGSTNVTLQFDLNRDINAAARDVQAAINAARGYLPTNLPNNPTYRKVNPADSPIFILALTSDVLSKSRMYDAASSILAQKLSQVSGVGQVIVGGGALPGVRIELNPTALNKYGIGLEQVRGVLSSANANTPKGHFSDGHRMYEVGANDQLLKAVDYTPLIIAYRNGSAVHISDVGQARDAPEDILQAGYSNGKPSVLIIIFRQPNANIIDTVDGVRAALPQLKAAIPQAIDMRVAMDQTLTIRASVDNVEQTLIISVLLVILVVFLFLRNPRTTFIPSVAVPVSLVGTFGVMYLLGYSLDNLSLMALTISTGFVVDDAIVMIENISRYIEMGDRPLEAALKGASEIGFTIVSLTVSLIAVLIPLLFMADIVGRLFREFAVTLAVTIIMSAFVSLTLTPMMAARILKHKPDSEQGRLYHWSELMFNRTIEGYGKMLRVVLRHQPFTILVAAGTLALTIYMFMIIPKGFFPVQDTGMILGISEAPQSISFPAIVARQKKLADVVLKDPGVQTIASFVGVDGVNLTPNNGRIQITLKPLEERDASASDIIRRLQPELAKVGGIDLYMQAVQDLTVENRVSRTQYQYTMEAPTQASLDAWVPKMMDRMRQIPFLQDVASDQLNGGLGLELDIDRDTASRFGITPQNIDDTLYDAFGQREVSTIFTQLNQYHVVLENRPNWQLTSDALHDLRVKTAMGTQAPLDSFTRVKQITVPLTIDHQGQFPAVVLSFNLAPRASLGAAVSEIRQAAKDLGMPASVEVAFQGTAAAFENSLANEMNHILAALITVYIVLGVLYES
ncbi:MAG: efflux RND transporter permease subunit, partial [Terriglobia bacterium]